MKSTVEAPLSVEEQAFAAVLAEPAARLLAAERGAELAQLEFELACGRLIEPHLAGARLLPRLRAHWYKGGNSLYLMLPDTFDLGAFRRAARYTTRGGWGNHEALARWLLEPVADAGIGHLSTQPRIWLDWAQNNTASVRFSGGMSKSVCVSWLRDRGVVLYRAPESQRTDLLLAIKNKRSELTELRRQLRGLK